MVNIESLQNINPMYIVYVAIIVVVVFCFNYIKKNIYKLANYSGKFYVINENIGNGEYTVRIDDDGKKTIKAECVDIDLNKGTVVYIEKVNGKYIINEFLSRICPKSDEAKLFKPVGHQKKSSGNV